MCQTLFCLHPRTRKIPGGQCCKKNRARGLVRFVWLLEEIRCFDTSTNITRSTTVHLYLAYRTLGLHHASNYPRTQRKAAAGPSLGPSHCKLAYSVVLVPGMNRVDDVHTVFAHRTVRKRWFHQNGTQWASISLYSRAWSDNSRFHGHEVGAPVNSIELTLCVNATASNPGGAPTKSSAPSSPVASAMRRLRSTRTSPAWVMFMLGCCCCCRALVQACMPPNTPKTKNSHQSEPPPVTP